MTEWTDKHYDFTYELTVEDISKGSLKVDPYFVAKQWNLGGKDSSGILFHNLKNMARWGDKNSVEREIKALHAQVKRLAELNGVELELVAGQVAHELSPEQYKVTLEESSSEDYWYPDDSGEWQEIDKDSDWSHLRGKKIEVLADYERELEAYGREVGFADWWFQGGWGNKVAYKIVG